MSLSFQRDILSRHELSLMHLDYTDIKALFSVLQLPSEHLELAYEHCTDTFDAIRPTKHWLTLQDRKVRTLHRHLRSKRRAVSQAAFKKFKQTGSSSSIEADRVAGEAARQGYRLEAKLGIWTTPTLLCEAHQRLNTALIRQIFYLVTLECADNADPIRRHKRHRWCPMGRKSPPCYDLSVRDWGDRLLRRSAFWASPYLFQCLLHGDLGDVDANSSHRRNHPRGPIRQPSPLFKPMHLVHPCEACLLALLAAAPKCVLDIRAGAKSMAIAKMEEHYRLRGGTESSEATREQSSEATREQSSEARTREQSSEATREQSSEARTREERTREERTREEKTWRNFREPEMWTIMEAWLAVMAEQEQDGKRRSAPAMTARQVKQESDILAEGLANTRVCEAGYRKRLYDHQRSRPGQPPRVPHSLVNPGKYRLQGGDGTRDCPARMVTKMGHRLPLPLLPEAVSWFEVVGYPGQQDEDRQEAVQRDQHRHRDYSPEPQYSRAPPQPLHHPRDMPTRYAPQSVPPRLECPQDRQERPREHPQHPQQGRSRHPQHPQPQSPQSPLSPQCVKEEQLSHPHPSPSKQPSAESEIGAIYDMYCDPEVTQGRQAPREVFSERPRHCQRTPQDDNTSGSQYSQDPQPQARSYCKQGSQPPRDREKNRYGTESPVDPQRPQLRGQPVPHSPARSGHSSRGSQSTQTTVKPPLKTRQASPRTPPGVSSRAGVARAPPSPASEASSSRRPGTPLKRMPPYSPRTQRQVERDYPDPVSQVSATRSVDKPADSPRREGKGRSGISRLKELVGNKAGHGAGRAEASRVSQFSRQAGPSRIPHQGSQGQRPPAAGQPSGPRQQGQPPNSPSYMSPRKAPEPPVRKATRPPAARPDPKGQPQGKSSIPRAPRF